MGNITSFLLTTPVIITTIALLIYIYFKYSFTYWRRKGIPYLEPSFPFGNIQPLAQEKQCFGEYFPSVYQKIKSQGHKYCGIYMYSRPIYIPIDLELVKSVLVNDFSSFTNRLFYYDEETDPLSGNLVNLRYEKWKIMRPKVSSNYTPSKMKQMFHILLANSEELDNILDRFVQTQEPIDIEDIVSRYTTDNIGSCAFGIDCNSLQDPNTEFRQYGKCFINTTFANAVLLTIGMAYPFLLKLFKITTISKKVSEFFVEFFKETVTHREQTGESREDFINLFIKLKNGENTIDNGKISSNEKVLTFNELAAQAFIVFMAGFETPSTALSFCLFELAINQDIQIRLRNEIRSVLRNHDEEISYDSIMEMTYMDQVLNETLRMYPIVSQLVRECVQDYIIPGTDITINKGTACVIPLLSIHRDPEYYPDPEKFDPERFTEEEQAKRDPSSYMPYGIGPRYCIGSKFATIQMKIGLTRLLRNCKFVLDPKSPVVIDLNNRGFLISAKEKIWLRAEKMTNRI